MLARGGKESSAPTAWRSHRRLEDVSPSGEASDGQDTSIMAWSARAVSSQLLTAMVSIPTDLTG